MITGSSEMDMRCGEPCLLATSELFQRIASHFSIVLALEEGTYVHYER